MDIRELAKGAYIHVNPEYNPKTKKGKLQPQFISNADTNGAINQGSASADILSRSSVQPRNLDYLGQPEKYADYNVTISTVDASLNDELAEAQSNWRKAFNALSQTVVSEVGIGTAKAFSDVADATINGIGSAFFNTNNDYTNPVSKILEEWKEDFERNTAPVYVQDNVDISNGGLANFGWWMKNMPSIASSLTLLLPAKAITAGATKLISKATKGRATMKAMRSLQKATGIEGLTSTQNINRVKEAENIIGNALVMRTAENYQEARGTYNEMKEDTLNKFNSMSDKEYSDWVNNHKDLFKDGTDPTNKEAVAEKIASESANVTFREDFANTFFDIAQLWALRDASKIFRNVKSTKVMSDHRASLEALGKTSEELAEAAAKTTKFNKFGNTASDIIKGTGKAVIGESTEGIEEAVNYIAQQEGLTVGKTLLDDLNPTTFGQRLSTYMSDPQLWESAFWGLAGGVVFQGLGSAYNQAQTKRAQRKAAKEREANSKTGEKVETSSWYELEELPEIKAARSAISRRKALFDDMTQKMSDINSGKNIFAPRDITTKEVPMFEGSADSIAIQQERARQTVMDQYIADITTDAVHSGTVELLEDYMSSNEMKQAMIRQGLVKESEADSFINNITRKVSEIKDEYNKQINHISEQVSAINADSKNKDMVPLPYIQILAKQNLDRILAGKNLDEQTKTIQDQINTLRSNPAFDGILDSDLAYEDIMTIGSITTTYVNFEAQKKQIKADDTINPLTKLAQVDSINKKQKKLLNRLEEITQIGKVKSSPIGRILYTLKSAEGLKYNEKDELVEDKDAIEKTDKEILKNAGYTVTDSEAEDIAKSLSEYEDTLNAFDTLSNLAKKEIDEADKAGKELKDISDQLYNRYKTLAQIRIAKILNQSDIATTKQQIAEQIDIIHNQNNENRQKMIGKATDKLVDLYDRYDREVIDNLASTYLNGESKTAKRLAKEQLTQKEDDAAIFADVFDILNINSDNNIQLASYIKRLIDGKEHIDAIKAKTENVDNGSGESSSTSQKPVSEPQPQPTDDNSAKPQETATAQGNTLNPAESSQGQQSQGLQRGTITKPMTRVTNNTTGNNKVKFVQAETKADGTTDIVGYNKVDGIPVYRAPYDEATFNELTGQTQTIKNVVPNDATPTSTSKVTSEVDKLFNIISSREDAANHNVTEQAKQELISKLSKIDTSKKYDAIINDIDAAFSSVGWDKYWNNRSAIFDWQELVNSILSENPTNSSTGGQESRHINELKDALNNNFDYLKLKGAEDIKADKNFDVDAAVNTVVNQALSVIEKENITEEAKDELRAILTDRADDLRKRLTRFKEILNKVNPTLKESAEGLAMASKIGIINNESELPDIFKVGFESFVDTYLKTAITPRSNGKKVINIKEILGIVSDTIGDPTVAGYVLDKLKIYLKSPDISKKYIVVDKDTLDKEYNVENSEETAKEAARERGQFRVNILDYIDFYNSEEADATSAAEYFNTLNALRNGDTLDLTVDGNTLYIKSGNVVIGSVTKGTFENNTFTKVNKGWVEDVTVNAGGDIVSNTMNLYKAILTSDDPTYAQIRDIILDAVSNKTISDKNIKDFKDSDFVQAQLALGDIGVLSYKGREIDDVRAKEMIEHLVKIYNFSTQNVNFKTKQDRIDNINYAIENYFAAVYNDLDILYRINKDTKIKIDYINDGEVNEKFAGGRNNPNYNRNDVPVVQPSIIKSKAKVAVFSQGDGVVHISGEENGPNRTFRKTTKVLAMYDRNGAIHYTTLEQLYSNENTISPGYNSMRAQIKNYLRLKFGELESYNTDAKYNEILNIIQDLIYTGDDENVIPFFIGFSGRKVIRSYQQSGKKTNFQFSSYELNKTWPIQFSISRTKDGFTFRYRTDINSNKENIIHNTDVNGVEDILSAMFSIINKYTMVNVDINGIKSDNNPSKNISRGIIHRKNGKIEVFGREYASYNDFLIENELFRCNLAEPKNNTNYVSRGNQQALNQVMYVSTEVESSLPVEENVDTTKYDTKKPTGNSINDDIYANVAQAFSKDSTSGKDLFIAAFGEEAYDDMINISGKFDIMEAILPLNMIYNPNLNHAKATTVEAKTNPTNQTIRVNVGDEKSASGRTRVSLAPGQVMVGDYFLKLISSNNGALRNRAVAVMIHERLHWQIRNNPNFTRKQILDAITPIYDAFFSLCQKEVDNYNKDTATDEDKIRYERAKKAINDFKKYNNIKAYPDPLTKFDEFLVESITNIDYNALLNYFDATEQTKEGEKNIFTRLLNFVMEYLFNRTVRDNSLLKQEFNILSNIVNNKDTVVPDNQKTVVTVPIEGKEQPEKLVINISNIGKTNIVDPFDDEEDEDSANGILTDYADGSTTGFISVLPIQQKAKFNSLLNNNKINYICKIK